jgi:hypothetical protein
LGKVGFSGDNGFIDGLKKAKWKCPPGCFVLFNQLLGHEVLATPAVGNKREPYAKLFMGFRLTRTEHGLMDLLLNDEGRKVEGKGFRNVKAAQRASAVKQGWTAPQVYASAREIYEDQGLPLLPSGQEVPQYSANHYGRSEFYTNRDKYPFDQALPRGLIQWSERFKAVVPRSTANWSRVKDTGGPVDYVARYFPSLGYMGLKLRPYDKGELQLAAGGPRDRWEDVWTYDDAAKKWRKEHVHLRGGQDKGGMRKSKTKTKSKSKSKFNTITALPGRSSRRRRRSRTRRVWSA